ncbi:hypothetical protein ABZ934_30695 [Streptomyces sp. NPDC046557]|uniref:hypothetical protein n=1 Tax=Streptomyces sp. NPDC046557 TaxID=3155372 RepID=UPI0033D82D39
MSSLIRAQTRIGQHTLLASPDVDRLNTELEGRAATVIPGFTVTVTGVQFDVSDQANYSDHESDAVAMLATAVVPSADNGRTCLGCSDGAPFEALSGSQAADASSLADALGWHARFPETAQLLGGWFSHDIVEGFPDTKPRFCRPAYTC